MHLRFANYHDLEADLLPKLRGRVFHVTTTGGYVGIQRDEFVEYKAVESLLTSLVKIKVGAKRTVAAGSLTTY